MSEVEKKEEVVEKKEEVVEKKEETTTEEKKGDEERAADVEPEVDFGERIKLEHKSIATNEEDEDVLYTERARLFRFDTTEEPHSWKEKGIGNIKFLEDKKTKKIRAVMRREKVFKVCLNHFVDPLLSLEVMPGSDRSWTWKCPKDYSDEEHPQGVAEIFAIRFGSAETANKFKETFDKCKESNKALSEKKE